MKYEKIQVERLGFFLSNQTEIRLREKKELFKFSTYKFIDMLKLKKHIFALCILVLGSCSLITKKTCGTLETEENLKIDSLIGDLNSGLRIHTLSLELKGRIEQEILFNDIKLRSGKVDTAINMIDQYSSTFIYEIHNPRNGKIQLDICANFQH